MRRIGLVLGVLLIATGAARAGDEIGIAVLEFNSKGGVTQEQVEALGDLLTNQIQALCKCQVIGKSDIRSTLQLEQQKMLLGCSDDSCMAEVGGALGVPWLCVGNVAKFGDDYLLNLRLIDVKAVKLAASASVQVRGGEDQLLRALAESARDLLVKAEDRIWPGGGGPDLQAEVELLVTGERPFRYTTWGHAAFWTGMGLAAFGGLAIWRAGEASDDWVATGSSSAASRHRSWNGAAYAGFGLGGVLMVTGAVMWLLDPGEEDRAAVAGGPIGDGRGAILSVYGRW